MLLIDHSGWPGCARNARIFFTTVENGALHVAPPHMHIIANSAYLLKQWLITALRDNGNLSKQKKTCQFCSLLADRRLTVQMATRWEFYFHDPEVLCSYIIIGCILHNLCIIHDEDIEKFVDVQPVCKNDSNL